MSKLDSDAIIAAYRDAFQAAHGQEPAIYYERGWFRIGYPSSPYRAKQVQEMIGRLRRMTPAPQREGE